MITHRVIVKSATGDEYIRENFDVSADAEGYFEQLQRDGGDVEKLLTICPLIVITLEEMYLGEWLIKSKKLVAQ